MQLFKKCRLFLLGCLFVYLVLGGLTTLPFVRKSGIYPPVRYAQYRLKIMSGFTFITGFGTADLTSFDNVVKAYGIDHNNGRTLVHDSTVKDKFQDLIINYMFFIVLVRGHVLPYDQGKLFKETIELNRKRDFNILTDHARLYVEQGSLSKSIDRILLFFCQQGKKRGGSFKKVILKLDYRFIYRLKNFSETEEFERSCD